MVIARPPARLRPPKAGMMWVDVGLLAAVLSPKKWSTGGGGCVSMGAGGGGMEERG